MSYATSSSSASSSASSDHNNSFEEEDLDRHVRPTRRASKGTSSRSSSSSSTAPSRNASAPPPHASSVTPQSIGPVIVPPPMPIVYRRMSPQEDLMATLLGIDVLVRQRQQLINQLVQHHHKLSRKNEIGSLVDFSKEIDRIMK